MTDTPKYLLNEWMMSSWTGEWNLPFPAHVALGTVFHRRESEVAHSCPTLCDPWTVAYQAPVSMEFSRQSTGMGCHLWHLKMVAKEGGLWMWELRARSSFHGFPLGTCLPLPFHSHLLMLLSLALYILTWLFQFSSVSQSCLALCNPVDCSTPGLPVHHELLESTQTDVHWVGDAILPSHPLLSPLLLLPPIPPSIRVFSNESALCMRWPKYWSFSFSIGPSNEHPGLIFFRMDWLDLLEVQGTLKSLLQHHSSEASILWRSAFLIVQLSHPHMTTGKTIALTRRTFVDKVMSLLFWLFCSFIFLVWTDFNWVFHIVSFLWIRNHDVMRK